MLPTRAVDDRILDADEVMNCPQFSTRLTSGPARSVARLLLFAGIGVVLGLGVMLGLIRAMGPRSSTAESSLRTTVSAPATVFREDGLEVTVSATNEAAGPAKDVRVRISGRSMRILTCQSVVPPEAAEDETLQRPVALIGELGPGESGSVTFRFSANAAGKLDLAAYVTASSVNAPIRMPIEGEIMP